jgi:hypothetical protein
MRRVKIVVAFGVLAIGVVSITGCASDTSDEPNPVAQVPPTNGDPSQAPQAQLDEGQDTTGTTTTGTPTSAPAPATGSDGNTSYQTANPSTANGVHKLTR